MTLLITILLSLYAIPQQKDHRISIMVIDTGAAKNINKNWYCKDAPPVTVVSNTSPWDEHPQKHGTDMINTIIEGLDIKKVCIYSIKTYGYNNVMKTSTFSIDLLVYAMLIRRVDIINISSSGEYRSEKEYIALKELTKSSTIVVAAGNEGLNLDTDCRIYPACYFKRIKSNYFVIGSKDVFSNKGKVIAEIIDVGGGTSFAAAKFTNKLAKILQDNK